ncbi:MAG TPA: GNAT family N-acetyltransferase, partial [Candidatus Methylomirabilis sp.]
MTGLGGNGLRVEVLNGAEGLAGLREEWEALWAAAGAGVFMSWEWMATWWRHYGAGRELHLIAVRDAGGDLVGVAPLMWGIRRYRGLPLRAIELLGAGGKVSPDLMDILALPQRADEVGHAVWIHLAGRASWDLLELDNVEAGAAAASALAMAARRDGLVWEIKAKASCPFIMLPATWEAYLAGRGSATRYDLRRKVRAIRRGHDVKLERAEDAPGLANAMEALFDLHAARWRTRGETGSFDRDPRNRAFHQAMAAAAQGRGWLRLYFLNVDGRRVAAFIGYEVGGRLSYYQLGWDPAWGRWSVGTVLIAEVLRDAIARGVKEFDFLRRAEAYKGRLAEEARGTVTVRVWGPTWRGGAHRALHRTAGWARRRGRAALEQGYRGDRRAPASASSSRGAPQRWKAVAVRPHRPGDEEAMAALYNAAHGHLAGFIERSAERLRWFFSRPGLEPGGIFVAERAGRLAGYAVVYREGDVAELAADPA